MSEQLKPPNIARVYTEQARAYINFSSDSFSWKFLEKPVLDKHIHNLYKPDTRVLDAGCGNGRIIEHLIKNGIKATNITGVDITTDLLLEARQNMPEVRYIHADIAKTGHFIEDNQYDLITAAMFFHYLDDDKLKNAMSNFYKWLKPNGTLFYVTTHPVRIVSSKLDHYHEKGWRDEDTPWGTKTPYFHRTTADYINETIKAGFRINVLDEPSIPDEGLQIDPKEYKKYKSYGPSRLVVKAIKTG